MSEFEDLHSPTSFDPTVAVAREMLSYLASAKPGMANEASSFILGAMQMGQKILVALSIDHDELSLFRAMQMEGHRQFRDSYINRKPKFDKEAT